MNAENRALVPPSDVQAEAAVLSAAILSAEAADEVISTLKEEDFFKDANRTVFRVLRKLTDDGTPVDAVSIASTLRQDDKLDAAGGMAYLAELLDSTPAVANVGTHAQIVADMARLRRAGQTFRHLGVQAHSPIGDVSEWLEYAEQQAYLATSDRASEADTWGTYAELSKLTLDELHDRAKQGSTTLTGHRTGFNCLDRHTGGLNEPDLWYVAGRPGMGKTSLMLQILEWCAFFNVGVVIFSLEMSRPQLLLRALCRRARVTWTQLKSGRLDADEWQRVTETTAQFAKLPLIIDDAGGLRPSSMRAKIRRHAATLRQRYGVELGAVGLDYVQLMEADERGGNRNSEIEQISRALKTMCKTFSIPIVALSQLKRSPKGEKAKRPQLDDLRDSGSLEADADCVLFIHRDDESRPETEVKDGLADLILAKGRNYGPGAWELKFDGRYTEFSEIAKNQGYAWVE